MTTSGRAHEVFRESLGVLALGKLDPDDGRPVLEHADECPECSAELDDLLEIAALLSPGAVRVPEPTF
ncbi:MAG TPA: hypothetical protein VGP26_10055 [Actinophytocola sp.]|nr:hypothetical protein [Actinophytocola sp.]